MISFNFVNLKIFYSMTFLPFCWLVPGDPGPFPAPFKRTLGDLDRFKKWFSFLTSIKDPEKKDVIKAIVATYKTIQKNNKEIFSINCIEAKPKNPIHQRIRADILNIIYKLKRYHDIPLSTPKNDEIIENVIGRILIYSHLNGIEYHKGFCEIVLPIFHVYYYGVLQSEIIGYNMTLIEAIVADSFVRLMTNPIFNHLKVFPPSKFMKTLLYQLIEFIKPYSIYQMIINAKIEPQFFASRWIRTIFVKDLDFSESIKLWSYLFDKSSQIISSTRQTPSSLPQSPLSPLTQSSSLQSLPPFSPYSIAQSIPESPLISPSLSQPLSLLSSKLSSQSSSQLITTSSSQNDFTSQTDIFHKNIVLLCVGCVLAREKACREVHTYEYLETIQDLDDISAEDIISQIENLEFY